MTARTLPLLALAIAGCSFTSRVDVEVPGASLHAPIVASMPVLGGDLLGYSEEALLSRASLVRMDDEATCLDLVLRHPGSAPIDRLPLSVEVDGVTAATFDAALSTCGGPDPACLPFDSPLRPYTREADGRIGVEAERVCLAHLPRARRDLVIGRQGMFAWRFQFHFQNEG